MVYVDDARRPGRILKSRTFEARSRTLAPCVSGGWRERVVLADKRVLVTGGAGFLGSFVVEALRHAAATTSVFRAVATSTCAMRRRSSGCSPRRPDLVMHLAAVVGGIGANRENPGRFFYDNMIMGTQLMEQAPRARASASSSPSARSARTRSSRRCPSRKRTSGTGIPRRPTRRTAWPRRLLLVQAQAYRQQYGFNAIYLLPVNLYGPRDNFDPDSSHVIPALIKKCVDAQEAASIAIAVWGTGSATREFLYVGGRGRGDRAGGRALRRRRSGQPRRRLRDLDQGPRRTHREAHRVPGQASTGTPPSRTDSRAAASTRRGPRRTSASTRARVSRKGCGRPSSGTGRTVTPA